MEDGNSKGNLPLGLNLPMIKSKMTLSFEEKSAIKALEYLLMFGITAGLCKFITVIVGLD